MVTMMRAAVQVCMCLLNCWLEPGRRRYLCFSGRETQSWCEVITIAIHLGWGKQLKVSVMVFLIRPEGIESPCPGEDSPCWMPKFLSLESWLCPSF